jgi:hypothetical protein
MINALSYYLSFEGRPFGNIFGIIMVSYQICSRWTFVRNRYGMLDLYQWAWVMMWARSIAFELVLRFILGIIVLVARI